MRFSTKRRLRIIRDYILGWTVAFIFLSIVRGVGTVEVSSVQFKFWDSILISLFFGPLFGTISGYAQILTEERFYKRFPIGKLVLFRLIYVVTLLVVIILASYFIVTQFMGEAKGIIAFAVEPGSSAIYFYIICVDLLLLMLRQINHMLGENNLWKLMKGDFYMPREEERIFMFLDLQASTMHAENLGHIKYSKMIQDCFIDLGVIVENEAEIYQYVGDEVILTWKLKDGLRNNNCINAFYNFKNQLQKKKDYYLKNYNCVPFFKAGLNSGIVTVTEVGKYKKEIAYHGDVINTAARIQGKCNELQEEFLIALKLKSKIGGELYTFKDIGDIALKGKEKRVTIAAVTQN
ncbi:adenylate/guanylate cyclase domain-containing protein [uncultured Maribacter sp.]|uniref:adenylate/guanylate cyclase domain-containing protein n=1 Tax=uncultured Maribacter sp. TaxID=431308 RepID=UPI0026226A9E|nr:adenylate/guanylate cyclase domain-containing protein [uncultured Maribacter sp.]